MLFVQILYFKDKNKFKHIDMSMFYNAKPTIFEKAKILRSNMTYAEMKLWEMLKKKQVLGLRFRAQHPIHIFIADFYCHSLKIVIEVDGNVHDIPEQKEYDIGREAEINQFGIKVIRFTNNQVLNDIDMVIDQIILTCSNRRMELEGIL